MCWTVSFCCVVFCVSSVHVVYHFICHRLVSGAELQKHLIFFSSKLLKKTTQLLCCHGQTERKWATISNKYHFLWGAGGYDSDGSSSFLTFPLHLLHLYTVCIYSNDQNQFGLRHNWSCCFFWTKPMDLIFASRINF